MSMTTSYFKLYGRDCWHFHLRCHHLRLGMMTYIVRESKPRSGELCNECQSKSRADKRTQAGKRK